MIFLIVDDEAPARGELKFMLQELEPEASLLEAQNGAAALELLTQEDVDVLFLDINMPGDSGLDIASQIVRQEAPPLIVFATAYDEHALKAFELEAVDYLLKPFAEERLLLTLERAKTLLADRELREEHEAGLRRYLRLEPLKKLWAERDNENRVLLDYSELYYFDTEDAHVYAHTYQERLLVRYTLKELESQLTPHGFARTHKGVLVNLDHILELVPWFSGNYLVRMNDAQKNEVKLSRRYAAQLKARTGWR